MPLNDQELVDELVQKLDRMEPLIIAKILKILKDEHVFIPPNQSEWDQPPDTKTVFTAFLATWIILGVHVFLFR